MSRLAWVTGASSGLGLAAAERLLADGGRVAVSARRAEVLSALASRHPDSLFPYPLDVTDRSGVADTVARIESEHGDIDLALLNAGTHVPMGVADFDCDTLRGLLEINVMGVAHGLEALLPRMTARRRGTIAVVSSVAGYCGLPSAAAYGASKAALINMTEALAPEAAAGGVTLKLVNPGFVRTPLTDRNDFPMPFLMDAEAAADRLVRGLTSGGFEVVFPRRLAWLMKGLRLLPHTAFFAITRRMLR